jgi:D-glycero-alpha-D-manno-heptose-7-phosphate kinase
MYISKTPLRISFFGGGTDFPDFFNQFGGVVVGSAINKHIYQTFSPYPKALFGNSIRFSYSQIEYAKTVKDIKHKPFRKILEYFDINEDIEINLASDLPSFSGMGSSSAFTVGLIKGLMHTRNTKVFSKKALADLAIHIERDILKEYVGYQDQIFAAYGGLNIIEFQKNDYKVTPVNISNQRFSKFNNSLILAFTGLKRKANDVEKKKFKFLSKKKIDALKQIKSIAYDSIKILEAKKNINQIGELFHQSWNYKKSLADIVSNGRIDEIYEDGLSAGALGGKLLGAGGGGFILFFVPEKNMLSFQEKMKHYYMLKFAFDKEGSKIL